MRAIQVSTMGGPEVLELVEVGMPSPAVDEVLVKVEAAGVNFIDTYLREGRYPAPLPFVPGQEGAGIVVEVGTAVVGFAVGDRVACAAQAHRDLEGRKTTGKVLLTM